MEPFFTRFTRTCQLTATRALPERILIWSKGTSPGTLTGHFFKESIINPIPSAPSTFLIESLATEWHRSASYSKLNAFPHCLLKCELRHFWGGNRKKKKPFSPLPTLCQLLEWYLWAVCSRTEHILDPGTMANWHTSPRPQKAQAVLSL